MPIKSKDSRVLTTEDEQNAIWIENCSETLNSSKPGKVSTNYVFQEEENQIIKTNAITQKEFKVAVKNFKNTKTPGLDEIIAKLLKECDQNIARKLKVLLNKC